MTKTEFLRRLAKLLRGMDPDERAQWLADYSEMIDDRMEEGLNEAQAVASMDTAEAAARQIRAEAGLPDLDETQKATRRTVLLLACTCPLWVPAVIVAIGMALILVAAVLSVIAAALVVVLAVLMLLGWAVLALYAAVAGLTVGSVGCVLGGILLFCTGHFLSGLFTFGAGLLLAGLVLPLFLGAGLAGKYFVRLCRVLYRWTRRGLCAACRGLARAYCAVRQQLTHRKGYAA
jgi:uncharacterized membrane protein